MNTVPDLNAIAVQLVPITSIMIRHPKWRVKVDTTMVKDFAQRDELPPIVVVRIGKKNVLADGEKRLIACRDEKKQTHIAAKVVVGDEFMRLALMGSTNLHGQPLTADERRSLLVDLLKRDPHHSDTVFARSTGFGARTIGTWRLKVPGADTDMRYGEDGRLTRTSSSARRAARNEALGKNAAVGTTPEARDEQGFVPIPVTLLSMESDDSGAKTLVRELADLKAAVLTAIDSWGQVLAGGNPAAATIEEIRRRRDCLRTALASASTLPTVAA